MKNSEAEIEKMIRDKGLTLPRITPGDIDSKIVKESYTMLPSGKTMVCELVLSNGFTVRGESSVVSHGNFDEEIGRTVSRDRARNKIWELEAYLLQQRLYEAGRQQCAFSGDGSVQLCYPAKFQPAEEGGFLITFRDVPEAISQAETVEEARVMASDALLTALDMYREAGKPFPTPSVTHHGEEQIPLRVVSSMPPKLGQPMHGGTFQGVITAKDGTYMAVVLLDAKPKDTMTWYQAEDWAESIGGVLPSRSVAAMLYANAKSLFDRTWYWTNDSLDADTGDEVDAPCAWWYGFAHGFQHSCLKSSKGAAVAVRLIPLAV